MTGLLLRTFVRDFENTSDPAVRERYGTLSGVVGIILNLFISLGKFAAGVLTGAVSVTADAFNNLSDAATSLVTLVGVELAKGAIEKILRPEAVDFSWLSVGILGVSILVKLWMYAFNTSLSRRISSTAMAATAADSLSDCVATSAVLLGLLAGHFAHVSIDGWVGVLVAAFVLRAGWESAKDTVSPLLGKAPDPELVKGIEEAVMAHPEIAGVHDLMVHDYGPGHVMATLHAEVSMDADIAETHDVIDNIERELGQKFHLLATIHMDPIATDDQQVSRRRAEMLELAKTIHPDVTIHDFRMVEGPTHTNLIFDMVLPLGCALTDDEARREMARLAKQADPKYIAVVQVDHSYV